MPAETQETEDQVQLNVRVSYSLDREIERRAFEADLSKAEIVRTAIRAYLAAREDSK